MRPEKAFWLLIPFIMAGAVAMDLYIPALPTMMRYFDSSPGTIQLTLSVFMYGFGLGQLVMGPISDRLGRRTIALFALIIFAMGSFLCMLAPNVWIFMLARVIQSVGACASYVVALAVVRDITSGTAAMNLYSRLNAAMGLAPISAPLIGAWLEYQTGHWQASFCFLTLLSLMVLYRASHQFTETLVTPTTSSELLRDYRHIMSHPVFQTYALCSATTMIGLFLYCAISPHLLILKFGFTTMQYGTLFACNAIVWMGASWLSTHWLRYCDSHILIKQCLILMCLAGLAMVIAERWDMVGPWYFTINMMFISATIGTIMGPTAALALEPFGHMAGSASAVLGAFQFTLAGLIGQMTITQHISNSYPLSMAIAISAAIAWLALKRLLAMTPHSQPT